MRVAGVRSCESELDLFRVFQSGIYRVLYTIEDYEVIVLSVRHGARQPLTADEVRRLQ